MTLEEVTVIERVMILMREHGIESVEMGKVKITLGAKPLQSAPVSEKKNHPPVTDDQILMNPYAGLDL